MPFMFTRYKNRMLEKVYRHKTIKPSLIKHLSVLEKINPCTPLKNATFVVIDTELTGLDTKKDSIVSIGAVSMIGGSINLGDFFYRITDPTVCFSKESILIHGITPQEVSECPSLDKILPEFIDFCRDAILVGHCVSIDLAFINKELKKLTGFGIQSPVIDTFKLYQWLKRRQEKHDAFSDVNLNSEDGLFEIAKKLSVPVSDAHDALSDAFITAQVFQRFLPELETLGIRTVRDILTIGKP